MRKVNRGHSALANDRPRMSGHNIRLHNMITKVSNHRTNDETRLVARKAVAMTTVVRHAIS